jgi:hypothetical protein
VRGDWHYRLEHGSYYWYYEQHVQYMCDEIAIAYSRDPEEGYVTMHKHGSPEKVKAWFDKNKARYEASGLFYDIEMVNATEDRKWSLSEINNCVINSGYLGILLETIDVEVVDMDIMLT